MQFQMICMICLSLLKVGKSSDKYNNVVYKNSELGQPVKITTFTSMPTTMPYAIRKSYAVNVW